MRRLQRDAAKTRQELAQARKALRQFELKKKKKKEEKRKKKEEEQREHEIQVEWHELQLAAFRRALHAQDTGLQRWKDRCDQLQRERHAQAEEKESESESESEEEDEDEDLADARELLRNVRGSQQSGCPDAPQEGGRKFGEQLFCCFSLPLLKVPHLSDFLMLLAHFLLPSVLVGLLSHFSGWQDVLDSDDDTTEFEDVDESKKPASSSYSSSSSSSSFSSSSSSL